MINILNAEPLNYSSEARKILESLGNIDEKLLKRNELLSCISEYHVLIIRFGFQIDEEIIEAGKNLTVIVTATTGLDHIDTEYAKSKSIKIISLQGEKEFLSSIPATAEYTWGLLLALMRRIPSAFESVKRGFWNRDEFRGHNLAGRKLGILGLGRIGERVALYGLAFEMNVLAFDPYRKKWLVKVKQCKTLKDLLMLSDVLTIHIPLNNETGGLIGKEELELMSSGTVLINTSRGGVLDEQALLEALENEKIAGAALDVLSEETGERTGIKEKLINYARKNANLIITQHLGGATVESMQATEVFIAKKLRQYLRLDFL